MHAPKARQAKGESTARITIAKRQFSLAKFSDVVCEKSPERLMGGACRMAEGRRQDEPGETHLKTPSSSTRKSSAGEKTTRVPIERSYKSEVEAAMSCGAIRGIAVSRNAAGDDNKPTTLSELR